MSDPIAVPSDLATYLGESAIDEVRATLLLRLAQQLCESVTSPLPSTAEVVVLTVAARAYVNAPGVSGETIGPFSVQMPAAGIYLTRAEQTALRRLSGGTGAFSIDPTPVDAGTNLPYWDQNLLWLNGEPQLDIEQP